MSIIAPAILATNPEEYKSQVKAIFPFAERVHIDVTDGEFAPNLTLPETQIWWPQEWKVDIHMMVARPSEHLETIIQLNPNMVIFHAEVEEDLVPIFERLKNETMIKPAVALLRSTVPETVAPAIQAAEHVLVFSGNLGEMGGRWDGGANFSNVFNLTQSGVDVVNVGSGIMQSQSPEQSYRQMEAEINRKGAI